MFAFDQVGQIIDAAKQKIVEERQTYKPIYDVIEQYVSDSCKLPESRRIIVGSTMGIDLLLEKERSLDDYSYELYSEDSLRHANDLVNLIDQALQKHSQTQLTLLKTMIPYHKYQIVVDNRILVIIYNLHKNTYNVINPIMVKTFDKQRNILVLSPEISLLDIYRTLYLPALVGDWETALQDENKLFIHLKGRLSPNISGGEVVEMETGGLTMGERTHLSFMILKNFITNNRDVVLIGEHAMHMLMQTEVKTPIIQLLSSDPERIFKELQTQIPKYIKKNLPVSRVTRELGALQDFRLTRTVIKVGDPANSKEILYIYNTLAYDLVPFNGALQTDKVKNKVPYFIQIGNPFVILRFLILDYWILRTIQNAGGKIDEKFSQQRLQSITGKLLALRSKMSQVDEKTHTTTIGDKFVTEKSLFRIFPMDTNDYCGIYEDELLATKLAMKDNPKKFFDYYPRAYYKKFDKYRSLVN